MRQQKPPTGIAAAASWAARTALAWLPPLLLLLLLLPPTPSAGWTIPLRADARGERSGQLRAAQKGDGSEAVPSYMLDLYQRFNAGLLPQDGSNTVRCIQGVREAILGRDVIAFSLDPLRRNEAIVKAEMRFYRRATSSKLEKPPVLSFHSVWSEGSSVVTEMLASAAAPSPSTPHGWQVIDVASPAKRALSAGAEKVILGVAEPTDNESFTTKGLELFLSHHSAPYVLVYANDTVNLTADQIDSRLRLREGFSMQQEADSLIDPERGLSDDGHKEPPQTTRRRKVLVKARQKRDVSDNEIPGDPDVIRRLQLYKKMLRRQRARSDKTPATSPDILQTRQGRVESKVRSGSGAQLIPWPSKDEFALTNPNSYPARGRKNGSASASRQRVATPFGGRARRRGSCGRKRLVLDFDDVGWAGWIIEPKSFEIHYCSGSCDFPMESALQPTNHATLQSLLKAVGVRPELPSPCCVPDKLSSVTLLYYDQQQNVILKNYPGMTVDTCACR